MSRMRCERCGLVDSRTVAARERAPGTRIACQRCGGTQRTNDPNPDALRRNAVKAVRSALTGLDHPIR